MKQLKRLLSCALALALTLGLTALPAAAAPFPDVTTHWARTYIESMTNMGMFKGYDDGSFKPENKLTAAEALALCARAVPIAVTTGTQIGDARRDDVNAILQGNQSWFYREFGICLELGILTETELRSLQSSGALTRSVSKEDLSRYLVRAMQLGPMAERLGTFSMTFTDNAAISKENQPYVYLLNIYEIVKGDESGAFQPKSDVTRAVMATMLTRAILFINDRGVSPDLPQYSSYEFKTGTVASISDTVGGGKALTLTSDLTGLTFVTLNLSADVPIYENNMKTTASALKVGRHVRVATNTHGTPQEVRVSGNLETVTGKVNGIDGNTIAITVDGVGRIVTMDTYTQVQVGSKTTAIGGPSLVDGSAGYTTAVCKLDDQGRLVSIQLSGGTQEEKGILAGVVRGTGSLLGSTVLRVTGFDGVTHQYTIAPTTTLMVNGLATTSLAGTTYAGSLVSVRVSSEDSSAVTVNVDTNSKYMQGSIRKVNASDSPRTVTISNPTTGRTTVYDVPSDAIVTYNDEETSLRNIEREYFVTALVNGGNIVRMDTYPGSAVTEGILTNRTFDSNNGVILEIKQLDDKVLTYRIDLTDLPTIERGDEVVNIDKLHLGDTLVVTVRYSVVTRIQALPQDANVIATVERIIQTTEGSTVDLTLTDGTKVTYTVSSSASVTQNGKEVGATGLKPGQRLAMVINGQQITSAQIQQSATVDGQLVGSIVQKTSNRELLLLVINAAGNEELVTVDAISVNVLEWDGTSILLQDLNVGDTVQVNGKYEGATFVASLILRR